VTNVVSGSGFTSQVFSKGLIVSSTATGTRAITGTILDAYLASGGAIGPYGLPTADQVCTAIGCSQAFAGGTLGISQTASAGASGTVAETAGVPSQTDLTVHQGDLIITTPGAVIDGLDIRGLVSVRAPNVTIKNSVVRGRPVTSDAALVSNSSPGLVIQDSELYDAYPSPYIKGFVGSNVTIRRTDIHDVTDQVHLTGGNVRVEASWLHDNLHYEVDPSQNNTPSHDDSVQIQAGANISIVGNDISGAHNSGIQITQNTGNVSGVVFSGNKIDGGGCSFNISEGGRGPVKDVTISGNAFGRQTKIANCAVIAPPTSMPTISNNTYVPDGAAVTVKRGK
jgi:hypothetical protein